MRAVAETTGATDAAIRWIKDDPDAAFARARRENKLVVVDLWAEWCHTCLSMQAFVLTDAKLPGAGARFVFLSVDTELAKNAEFLRSHKSDLARLQSQREHKPVVTATP